MDKIWNQIKSIGLMISLVAVSVLYALFRSEKLKRKKEQLKSAKKDDVVTHMKHKEEVKNASSKEVAADLDRLSDPDNTASVDRAP